MRFKGWTFFCRGERKNLLRKGSFLSPLHPPIFFQTFSSILVHTQADVCLQLRLVNATANRMAGGTPFQTFSGILSMFRRIFGSFFRSFSVIFQKKYKNSLAFYLKVLYNMLEDKKLNSNRGDSCVRKSLH